MIRKTLKATALSLLLASVSASTLQSDSKQPTQIEVDQDSLNRAKRITHFSGNVIIKQDTFNLHVVSVRVSCNDKDEQFMAADGSPVKFSQTLNDNQGAVNGQANSAEYSSATGIVKLIGNAKVQRGDDAAQGTIITYNTRTEVYNAIGGDKSSVKAGTKSGRASIVIQPSSTQEK